MPPPDPLPSPAERRADLKRLMEIRASSSTEPPSKLNPTAQAEVERRRRFAEADRYSDLMNMLASGVVGAITAAFAWHYSGSLAAGAVIGFLWGGLIYSAVGWEQERRRRKRDRS